MPTKKSAPKKTRKHKLDDAMAEKGYVTPTVAAELLHAAVSTVHRLCADGRLECIRVGGDAEGRHARTYVRRDSVSTYFGKDATKILTEAMRIGGR